MVNIKVFIHLCLCTSSVCNVSMCTRNEHNVKSHCLCSYYLGYACFNGQVSHTSTITNTDIGMVSIQHICISHCPVHRLYTDFTILIIQRLRFIHIEYDTSIVNPIAFINIEHKVIAQSKNRVDATKSMLKSMCTEVWPFPIMLEFIELEYNTHNEYIRYTWSQV